jgi:segregation and condensation protein A
MTEPEFESILEAYPVRLANFEGPLDLLLHLIKTNEVNIYDIPIKLITQQYLEYIDLMQELNLDVAGEFLVMAATLIHIKSRMLLPRPDPAQEDPEEDPREALMRRLLEHQKFKAAAELLHERETLRSAQWTRADGPIAEIAGEAPEPEVEVDLFSLISAFRAVVERAKQRPKMYLPGEQMAIEDRIEQLLTRLSETEACGFEDLFADVQTRAGLIVTFLALLEMIRLKLVRVFQSGAIGPIRVYKRARPADAPKPILDPEVRHAHEMEAHAHEHAPTADAFGPSTGSGPSRAASRDGTHEGHDLSRRSASAEAEDTKDTKKD